MRTFSFAVVCASLLVSLGCDPEAADIATEEIDDRPDVTGSYSVTVTEVEGCTDQGFDLSWMEGALEVTGEAVDLAFEFPNGNVLLGEVDPSFAVDAEGTVQPADNEVDAVFQGIAVLGDDGFELDGDVAADVIDSTGETIACTLTGRLEALQTP